MLDLSHSIWIENTSYVGISPSLLKLQSLSYLDLSGNNFAGTSIPEFLGSFTQLRYLNLSNSRFSGRIPNQIGNLSNLQYLDINTYQIADVYPESLHVYNLDWISGLSSLKYLDMSRIKLNGSVDWFHKINHLDSLVELRLSGCQLGEISSSPTHVNFTSLKLLHLSENFLICPILKFLENVTWVMYLDLSYNEMHCSFPPHLVKKMTSLAHLDISSNFFQGPIPDVFDKMASSLSYLDLSWNNFTGYLPQSFKQLSQLVVFDVSGNSLEGVVLDSHLLNLSKLHMLDISSNLLRCNFSFDWIPPLHLDYIGLRSCSLGPAFPAWLQILKNVSYLDLSNNGIKGRIPSWYWSMISNMRYMNLSYNHISGKLPKLSPMLPIQICVDLSSNHLEGPIPPISPNIILLNLSKNFFSATISDFLCKPVSFQNSLQSLHLSKNRLSGRIPDCFMYWKNMLILNLENNEFSGEIPNSIGYMHDLSALHFRKNKFSGGLPFSLKNCTSLLTIDVGENSLSGVIPEWIGETLPRLEYLNLHSNQFNGYIPSELCHLQNLYILDLAHNNIHGTIPKCLGNFSGMGVFGMALVIGISYTPYAEASYLEYTMLSWKGKEHEYRDILRFVKMIDLSGNKLSGVIPEDVANLFGLIALNLSGNCLTGTIPNNIGHMGSLEFLDLSNNLLSGAIPMGLSNLTLLNGLDLSYNNLSGTIPLGTQLQSFDASSFMGNPKLCGAPLLIKCTREAHYLGPHPTRDENVIHVSWFWIGLGVGYVVGFWGVCSALLFIRSWRIAYFRFVDEVQGWIVMAVGTLVRKLKRHFASL